MALLTPDIQDKVREYLAGMDQTVTLEFYPRPGNPGSDTTRDLFNEIAGLTDKVVVKTHSDSPAVYPPETAEDLESAVTELTVNGRRTGIRYLGLPSGHEFGALLDTLVSVSTNAPVTVSADAQAYLREIQSPLHLYVFVTPT